MAGRARAAVRSRTTLGLSPSPARRGANPTSNAATTHHHPCAPTPHAASHPTPPHRPGVRLPPPDHSAVLHSQGCDRCASRMTGTAGAPTRAAHTHSVAVVLPGRHRNLHSVYLRQAVSL